MFDAISQKFTPGAVAILPTDTIYGVVARAHDQAAVARLYALKHREGKPGTIIAASIDQLIDLGIKARYLKAVEQFWPAQVSVVIPCADPTLNYLHQGQQSLAVRLPANKALHDLLLETGPLLTSSANHPTEPPATTINEAKQYFGDAIDFYVDGGKVEAQPSTVLRIVDDAIEVLRQGATRV